MTVRARTSKRLLIYSLLTASVAMAAWLYGLLFDNSSLLRNLFVTLSFLGLGILIKYADQAYDEDIYSKRTTLLMAVPGGLWMGALIAIDGGSATICIGLLFALLIAGKYDNLAFKIGFVVALSVGTVAIIYGIGTFNLLGAAIVLAAAFLDEKANDLPGVDGGNDWKAVLFHHRPILKVAVLALCVVGILPSLLYFFAFLAFDFGYVLVEALSARTEAPALG
jgi:hypothetical protein